jgi:hypothetical protein
VAPASWGGVEGSEEFRRIGADPREFVSRLKIIDMNAHEMDFDVPHEEQVVAFSDFTSEAETIIHLKPRQIGDTTVLAAVNFDYTYWATDAVRTLIVADTDESNDSIFQRIQFFHDTLPNALKRPLMRSNKKEQIFADTLAGMRVLTAGGRGKGRAWTYQRLHADEVAFWPNAHEVWGSITSTLHKGPHHKVFIVSTPNGPGNLFHEKVLAGLAARRAGDSRTIFRLFRWCDHAAYQREPPPGWEPGQEEYELAKRFNLTPAQLYWRHEKIHGVDGVGHVQFRRQYPLTVEDGFLVIEGGWFDVDYLNTVLSGLSEKPMELRVYEKPRTGMTYSMGVDGAWCNGGDNAVAQVLSNDGRQVAVFSTNQGGDTLFATRAAELAIYYNRARVLCEANPGGAGTVIIREMQRQGLPLWHPPAGRLGDKWTNTRGANSEVYAHLRQMVNGDALTLNDMATVQELTHIREVNGKVEGQDGSADDHADALALAEWNRRTLPVEDAYERFTRREVTAHPHPFSQPRGLR